MLMVKIERTQPAPASLAIEERKVSGKYNCQDVVDRLKEDFHNKCYICEIKNFPDIQVEHRLPHKGGKIRERMYDWNNLFLTCPHCNDVKNVEKYDEGIIDCCVTDPEKVMKFVIDGDIVRAVAMNDDSTVKLTAQLINEVFNKTNTGIRTHACKARVDGIKKEMNMLSKELYKYETDSDSYDVFRLEALLDKASQYAAFKRCFVRDRLNDYPTLRGYV